MAAKKRRRNLTVQKKEKQYKDRVKVRKAKNKQRIAQEGRTVCNYKVTHKSYKKAKEICDDYNKKVVLTLGAYDPYYCHDHEGWHTGHRRWKKEPWHK